MTVEQRMRQVLADVLQLGSRAQGLDADTPLLGHLPELDSMAVAAVLTGIEEEFGLNIDDDDVSAEMFETFGALCAFVAQKQAA
ncbi:MAG: acyl carrier protein [Sphingomonadales bacterium]